MKKKDKSNHIDFKKKRFGLKYLFCDIVKYLYFTRIWLWQRPKYCYVNKQSKKALKEPFMIISNHVGFSDCLMVYYAFFSKRPFFLIHQNTFNTPFKAWIFKHLLCIPADPETGSFTAIRNLIDCVKAGNSVCIFPEGHISLDTSGKQDLKGGATLIALQTGIDVINMYRERRKHWWQRNRIIVGEPYNLKSIAGNATSRKDLDKVNGIISEEENKLKVLYQKKYSSKQCKRTNTQVFITKFPFDCDKKVRNKQRREEIESCKSEKTRNEKFYSYKFLEKILKEQYGENLNKLHFKKLENGKWVIDRHYVSISHSGSLIALSISSIKHGIDIQEYGDKDLSTKLADKVYQEDEKPTSLDKETFIQDWSTKEALFKMSDDNAFDPKKYSINSEYDKQNKVIKTEEGQYALALVQETKGFVSYHLYSDDIYFE